MNIKMKRNPIHKKESNKSLILSLFIAFIMISSAFGVVFYGYASNQPTQVYNGFKFKPVEGGYTLKKDGKTYLFEILPQDTEGINISGSVSSLVKNSIGVAMTSEYTSSYAQEIALQQYNLQQILSSEGKQYRNGFLSDTGLYPQLSCLNASTQAPVISFTESNTTSIESIGSCIIISFDTGSNLKRAVSRLMYTLIGVIDA